MKDVLADLAVIVVAIVIVLGAVVVGVRYLTPHFSGDFLIVNGQPAPKGDRLTVITKSGCPVSPEGN